MARYAFGIGAGTLDPNSLKYRGGGPGMIPDPIGGATAGAADAATASTDTATAIADFTAAVGTASGDSLIELLNNQTWTAGTLQLSGTPGASVTLTVTQQEGLIALINALGTALLAVKTDLAAVVTDLAASVTSGSPALVVSFDTTKISGYGMLRTMLDRVAHASQGVRGP